MLTQILSISLKLMCFCKCSELHHESFGTRQLMREGGNKVKQRVLAESGNFSTIALFIIPDYLNDKNKITKHSSWEIKCVMSLHYHYVVNFFSVGFCPNPTSKYH